jgi:hypothetical protein
VQQTSSGLFVPQQFKKAAPPKLGPSFGAGWTGDDIRHMTLPGGGVIQFDLSKLTLADYRSMRDHYQINASMSVLSFMVHQAEWTIECKDKKIATAIEEMLRPVWSRLVRAGSQAYWAGYAPTVIEWDNDIQGRRVVPTKFKDIMPEIAEVNWKKVNGYAPRGETKPKINIYDGIKIHGVQHPVPVDNTFWYPLLMENGNYYGRKLLRPAFPSWFFSILIHLFSNRYFERFGEPVPIGRADFEAEVMVNGTKMNGQQAMAGLLTNLRNRGVVVLPSDRIPVGDGSRSEYAFDIEYLESQMRGADFSRYLDRLDEEMSIGLFTPVLLLRTADVGSYNLGVGHMQMYMWMLNAILADFADYVSPYVVDRAKALNFSPNAPEARIIFKPMGKQNVDTMKAMLESLMSAGKVKPDIDELGQAVGMTLTEIRETTEDPATGEEDESGENKDKRSGPRGVGEPRATTKQIAARLDDSVKKAYREGTIGHGYTAKMGHRRGFRESLVAAGADRTTAQQETDRLYAYMDTWLENATAVGRAQWPDADAFMSYFCATLNRKVEELASD